MASTPPSPANRSRWAIARTFADAGHRSAAAWRALPAGNIRSWLLIIIVGWIGCALLMFALARLGQSFATRGMQAWDERTLLRVEASERMSFNDAILAESPGNLAYLVPVTLAVALIAALRGRPVLAMTVVASYVLARFLVLVGWKVWDRTRPQLIADGIAAPPLHSFPSGHTALALSVWGLLAYLWIAASRSWVERILVVLLLLAWISIIGTARVRLGSHWPSDVIAGGVLGIAWLAVVILALRRGESGAELRATM
jgi:undecaprenyl-diphosphatase